MISYIYIYYLRSRHLRFAIESSVVVKRSKVPPIPVLKSFHTSLPILFLVQTTAPSIVIFLIVPCVSFELLPHSRMVRLHWYFSSLSLTQCSFEVCFHRLCLFNILLVLSFCLIHKTKNCCIYFFLRSIRVVKDVPELNNKYLFRKFYLSYCSSCHFCFEFSMRLPVLLKGVK